MIMTTLSKNGQYWYVHHYMALIIVTNCFRTALSIGFQCCFQLRALWSVVLAHSSLAIIVASVSGIIFEPGVVFTALHTTLKN